MAFYGLQVYHLNCELILQTLSLRKCLPNLQSKQVCILSVNLVDVAVSTVPHFPAEEYFLHLIGFDILFT